MQAYNEVILRNQPLNVSFNGPAMQLNEMFGYAFQVEWTGTANGIFFLQASTDSNIIKGGPVWPVNWTTVADSSITITNDGSVFYNVTDVMYNWVRICYTDNSSGTSVAIATTVTFNGKGN